MNYNFDPAIGKHTQFGANGKRTAIKAGQKSGRRRRIAKNMREAITAECEKIFLDQDGNKQNGYERVVQAIIDKAMLGDVPAMRLLCEILGELNKPQKVEISGKVETERKQLSVKEARAILAKLEEEI